MGSFEVSHGDQMPHISNELGRLEVENPARASNIHTCEWQGEERTHIVAVPEIEKILLVVFV